MFSFKNFEGMVLEGRNSFFSELKINLKTVSLNLELTNCQGVKEHPFGDLGSFMGFKDGLRVDYGLAQVGQVRGASQVSLGQFLKETISNF